MVKYLFTLCIFFATTFALAKVVHYEVTGKSVSAHSYNDVCSSMGYKHILFVETKGIQIIDCMGKSVHLSEFCAKANSSPNVLRGFVNKEEKNVLCETGKTARLEVLCTGKATKYCFDANTGCNDLKKSFAFGLDLIHSSKINLSGDQWKLSCAYETAQKLPSVFKK